MVKLFKNKRRQKCPEFKKGDTYNKGEEEKGAIQERKKLNKKITGHQARNILAIYLNHQHD